MPARVTSGSFSEQTHLSEGTFGNQREGRECPACAPQNGKQGLLCRVHTVRRGARGDGGVTCMLLFHQASSPDVSSARLGGCNRGGDMCSKYGVKSVTTTTSY